MAGRFNKILEFIGLVDDEPEEERELQGRRPVGGQTYGAQSRRAAPQAAPRGYEEPRSRYTSSRPEYDARARRSEAQPGASRYASGQGYQGGIRARAGTRLRAGTIKAGTIRAGTIRAGTIRAGTIGPPSGTILRKPLRPRSAAAAGSKAAAGRRLCG